MDDLWIAYHKFIDHNRGITPNALIISKVSYEKMQLECLGKSKTGWYQSTTVEQFCGAHVHKINIGDEYFRFEFIK